MTLHGSKSSAIQLSGNSRSVFCRARSTFFASKRPAGQLCEGYKKGQLADANCPDFEAGLIWLQQQPSQPRHIAVRRCAMPISEWGSSPAKASPPLSHHNELRNELTGYHRGLLSVDKISVCPAEVHFKLWINRANNETVWGFD